MSSVILAEKHPSFIMIGDVKVHMDKNGRYCLNDFHRGTGGEKRNAPNEWARNKQTVELVEELSKPLKAGLEQNQPLAVVNGGSKPGTYVCKELVHSYAMWVSAAHHLLVIRAFDALANGRIEEAISVATRQTARLEYPAMSDALHQQRLLLGKETKAHHHINEAELLNRIALGMTAAKFRESNGLAATVAIRDHLMPEQIRCIKALQRANTTFLEMGL